MIRKADTMGTFQIESRAQMSMLPRLKPKTFYDLVIEVAIVRPGPIQGDMVHPYIRRREGKEPVHFPTPALEKVLGKTLGVPLFQEQAMQVAMVAAGFSPTEADQLRRSMATFKFTGGVHKFQDKLITGMLDNGYTREFAERTFRQLEGFGSYGFPESHAASFALIAYASSWMKCHHPDVFLAAILNAQPMGFYAPAQLVRDAREHGVEVRPVDINHSEWDCTLETTDTHVSRRAPRLLHGAKPQPERCRATGDRRTYDRIAATRSSRPSRASKMSGGAPACRWRRSTTSPRPTGFAALVSRGARPPGQSRACAMKPCRSLPPPMIVRAILRPEAHGAARHAHADDAWAARSSRIIAARA